MVTVISALLTRVELCLQLRLLPFEVGWRIWLMLPGRDRANAIIRWTAGDKLGGEFSEPIDLDGFRR
jgi:hypothetical protein